MNKFLFTTLVLSSVLVSCSPKKSAVGNSNFNNRNIVLGAFNDVKTSSSLDESKLKDLPRVINLREDMSAVKNQSDRGTCTFFATAALIEGTIKKDLKLEINMSEEYLNYSTKTNGYFSDGEGSTVSSNISTIKQDGIMLERDWSYQPTWFGRGLPCADYKNSDSTAPAKCFAHSAPSDEAISKVIRPDGLILGSIGKNTNEVIKFIAKNKRPLTVDVPVNFNGWPSTGDVYHNEELRAECIADDSHCGGHAVLLTGYDMDKKVFFFKNSWGSDWGNGGFGTITFETIDRYVSSPLFYAQAKENLKIPKDFDKDYLNLESFESSVLLQDASLDVALAAKVTAANGRAIYVSSFISKKAKSITEAANDTNTKTLQLLPAESTILNGEGSVRELEHYLLTEGNDLEIETSLSIPGSTLKMESVAELLTSELDQALMRTTIYVHTDNQTYKILKRSFQPIAQ